MYACTGAEFTGTDAGYPTTPLDCSTTGVLLTGVELTGVELTGVELSIGAGYGIEGRPVPTVPVPVGPAGTLLLPMGKGAEEGARTGDEAAADDSIGAPLGAPPLPPLGAGAADDSIGAPLGAPPLPPLGAGIVTVTVLAFVIVTVDGPQEAPLSPSPPEPEPGAPDGEEPEPAEPDAGELPIPPAPDNGELPTPAGPEDAGRGMILMVD